MVQALQASTRAITTGAWMAQRENFMLETAGFRPAA
jgi:hypothetical protein